MDAKQRLCEQIVPSLYASLLTHYGLGFDPLTAPWGPTSANESEAEYDATLRRYRDLMRRMLAAEAVACADALIEMLEAPLDSIDSLSRLRLYQEREAAHRDRRAAHVRMQAEELAD